MKLLFVACTAHEQMQRRCVCVYVRTLIVSCVYSSCKTCVCVCVH